LSSRKLSHETFNTRKKSSLNMKPEKAEKIFGYTLLVVGLVLIILPVMLALMVFLGGLATPQLVPVPTGEHDGFAEAFAIFSNVCLIFFIFIILVWAGSIISTRGVTMIKDVKLKLVGKSLREAADAAEKLEEEEA